MKIENTNEYIIDSSNMKAAVVGNNLYETRKNYYDNMFLESDTEVSILIIAYNRFEKTKNCVESVLKYTKDINYELLLVDHGSTDETYEYFKSINYPKKKIVRVTKNVRGSFVENINKLREGKIFVTLGNDIVVTNNWLHNLLVCINSSPDIGMVVPMMTNCSNLQEPNIKFSSLDEMQKIAEDFNKSDPKKWEERMRLVTPMSVMKKEVFDMVGIMDNGFFHDFGEDDLTLRIRRAGYKLILCGDTFIHHDHDFRNMEDKDPIEFKKSIEEGRKNFKEKYHGLDAWDDIISFELNLVEMLKINEKEEKPKILGIDVKCGTPILQIKNKLRKNGIYNSYSMAFTTNAKYYEDLLTINNVVYSDRIEYLTDYFKLEDLDYVILGEPLNMYDKPIRLIQKMLEITKKGGKILCKLKNTSDIKALLLALGMDYNTDGDMAIHISVQDLVGCINTMGVKDVKLSANFHNLSEDSKEFINKLVCNIEATKNNEEAITRLQVNEFLFCIEK